jgi:hypothetical protein
VPYSGEAASTAQCPALAFVLWLMFPGSDEESRMTEQTHEPGPGRSTSDRAFNELTKDIALRNEHAHREARKLRAERERKQIIRRREQDLA